MTNKKIKLDLFRFQLLPVNRYFQGNLLKQEINSLDKLIDKKNHILQSILTNLENIEWKNHYYKVKIEFQENDLLLLRLAPRKAIKIEKETLEEETIDHWPSITIMIWNDPDKQIILIQDRKQSFSSTKTVVNLLQYVINNILFQHNLVIFIEPIFKKEYFWKIINKHAGKIKMIKFYLITPNMSNISETLSEELKNLAKTTNTSKTLLQFDSDKHTTLHIDKSNKTINNLVDYTSKGGGDIMIKVKGLKNSIHTSRSIKKIEIDEFAIKGNLENIKQLLDEVDE